MKKKSTVVGIVVLLILVVVFFFSCAGEDAKRLRKTLFSNYTGGLDRTVTVYDYEGDKLEEWSGKMDLTDSEEETMFDLYGKRIVIKGGITIIKEN